MSAGKHRLGDEFDARLRELYRDRTKSMRQIADILGVSVNSVVGRVRRMGLSDRGSPIKPRAVAPVTQPPRAHPWPRGVSTLPPLPSEMGEGRAL